MKEKSDYLTPKEENNIREFVRENYPHEKVKHINVRFDERITFGELKDFVCNFFVYPRIQLEMPASISFQSSWLL